MNRIKTILTGAIVAIVLVFVLWEAFKWTAMRIYVGPDEALVVDCDIPESRYWSFHLYSLAWWEALEYGTRVTTRNHTQTRISDDGRIRVVVAHEDPGVANWLDAYPRSIWEVAPRALVADKGDPAGCSDGGRAACRRAPILTTLANLRREGQNIFAQTDFGYDILIGPPKGSPLAASRGPA